jgi:hypothetical protein
MSTFSSSVFDLQYRQFSFARRATFFQHWDKEPVSTFDSYLERTKGVPHGWQGGPTDKVPWGPEISIQFFIRGTALPSVGLNSYLKFDDKMAK